MLATLIPAIEAGLSKYDWWLDWRGRTIAIVASGPSTKPKEVAQLHGRLPIIAIKENVDILPAPEVVYGCDRAWWANARGLPKFKGLKVTASGAVTTEYPDVRLVKVTPFKEDDRIFITEPGVLGSGGNSGFQALNLAVQFGATRILLVGFDMNSNHDLHWFGPAKGFGRSNPTEFNFVRWRRAYDVAAVTLRQLGVEVVNASPLTSLKSFPVLTIENTLKKWGL
jgi:hypothetical protein